MQKLQIGNVLESSWGYEQTNVSYYMVTKLVGKTMVQLQRIGKQIVENGQTMTGQCVPDKNQVSGEPFRKKPVDGGTSVKIESYEWAKLITPEIVHGVEIFQPASFTTYA